MSNIAKFAAVTLLSYAQAEKEGNTFHPVLSWTGPLGNQDFKNWDFFESSVALNDKMVLAPNGNEQYGLIANRWVSWVNSFILACFDLYT